MNKKWYYMLMQNLHMIRNELKFDVQHDLQLYCKTYNVVPEKITPLIFMTILELMRDTHVYELNTDAHDMVLETLVEDLPMNTPELILHPFLLCLPKPVIAGFDLIAYSPILKDNNYLMQFGSSNLEQACVCMQGVIADIGKPTRFSITDVSKDLDKIKPKETPEEIKAAIFKFLYTFSILLEAHKTPLEIEGRSAKLKNHFAKRAGVDKRMWRTNYIFLNANVKRMYEEAASPMDKDGKVQIPTITRAHIRNIKDREGRLKQVFVASYVSDKWHTERLVKNKVKTIEF